MSIYKPGQIVKIKSCNPNELVHYVLLTERIIRPPPIWSTSKEVWIGYNIKSLHIREIWRLDGSSSIEVINDI